MEEIIADADEASRDLPADQSKRLYALSPAESLWVASSVCFVVVYMSIQLSRIPQHRPVPVWPTIAVPFALSIIAAVRIRNIAVPPLVCALGVTSGALTFALFRGWLGADLPFVLPLAIASSIPSWLVSGLTNRHA